VDDNKVMGRPCKYGHSGLRYKHSRACVQCNKERNSRPDVKAQQLKANKRRYQEVRNPTLEQQRAYRETPRGRALQMLQGVRARSKKKGLSVSITLEWLEGKLSSGVCEITGLPFDFSRVGLKGPHAPSLDRIDASKGYVPENCRVILWALNTAFSWWGEESFGVIAKAWFEGCGASHDRDINAAKNILSRAEVSASVSGNEFLRKREV